MMLRPLTRQLNGLTGALPLPQASASACISLFLEAKQPLSSSSSSSVDLRWFAVLALNDPRPVPPFYCPFHSYYDVDEVLDALAARKPSVPTLPSLFNMNLMTALVKSLEPRIDDDFIDRLNYYYTSTILIMFAVLVSAKQYVGHPIECWVPAQFTKAMEQYAENYCWVQNTYWVPFNDFIPDHPEEREKRQIGYYQWVPFILTIEAVMFYIPTSMWRFLNAQSGINVPGILQMACDDRNIEPENRISTVNILSRHIDDALRYQRDFGQKGRAIYLWTFVRFGKFYGAYVAIIYCFVKLLYFVNVLGQFFLLNRFLAISDYSFIGGHVIWNLIQGIEWQNTGIFPRVTLCDFEIRVLGNIHRHTIQCVLVINMFTEKIFLFLWLWFLCLSAGTFVNMVYWFLTVVTPSLRVNFVQKCLELSDAPPDTAEEYRHLKKFVTHYLRPDGIFILRMISSHSGMIMCAEVVCSLWTRYREVYKQPTAVIEPLPPMKPRVDSQEAMNKFESIKTLENSPRIGHRKSKLFSAVRNGRFLVSTKNELDRRKRDDRVGTEETLDTTQVSLNFEKNNVDYDETQFV